MIRKIIQIDENKCDGCGICVEACHEGAIGMVIKGNIEDNLVKTNKEFTKSISKSNTFCNLENDLERIDKEIIKIVEEIQEIIAQNKIEARTITITIKAFNFKKISKSQTFKTPINQNNLLAIARNLFLDIFDNQEINYLSIGLSKLQWV